MLLLFVFGPKIYVLLSYEPVIVESCDNNKSGFYKDEAQISFNNFDKSHDLFEAGKLFFK